jgi:hypothetical protein
MKRLLLTRTNGAIGYTTKHSKEVFNASSVRMIPLDTPQLLIPLYIVIRKNNTDPDIKAVVSAIQTVKTNAFKS